MTPRRGARRRALRGSLRRTGRRGGFWLGLDLALVALLVVLGATYAVRAGADTVYVAQSSVPRSQALEELTGVRFSRVAVVGDGGLVTVFYVVLDPERATQFQADREHTPRLSSEARHGATQRTSIMRTGHQMRAGATYYLVYENSGQVLRSGELTTLTYRGVPLRHVPVL